MSFKEEFKKALIEGDKKYYSEDVTTSSIRQTHRWFCGLTILGVILTLLASVQGSSEAVYFALGTVILFLIKTWFKKVLNQSRKY